jgi:hypothetical protein
MLGRGWDAFERGAADRTGMILADPDVLLLRPASFLEVGEAMGGRRTVEAGARARGAAGMMARYDAAGRGSLSPR